MIDRSGYGRGGDFRPARDFTDIHWNWLGRISAEKLDSIIGVRITSVAHR
jgi:hypothetical protein